MTALKTAAGRQLGLDFPVSIEALLEQGPEFLTRAFRASGALGNDNSVTTIAQAREFFGGGAGRKLALSIRYAKADPRLHTELFVKYPRDFGDPLRDLFAPLMESETRFALLSRQDHFAVAVPRCYFADYDPQTRSGILITERIAYGQDAIEPCHDKCLDYELEDPLAHYQALVRTIARLAGAHKSGRLGDAVESQFPHDPTQIKPTDRIPFDRAGLAAKIDALRAFVQRCPRLFETHFITADFIDRFSEEAGRCLDQELAIKSFLNSQPDYIALCHWNANVDNAWFWKNPSGQLEAGLLDWGSVSQMNLAQAFFGLICAAETDFLDAHQRSLMRLFIDEYQQHGGPALDLDAFDEYVKLSIAVLGLAWMLDAPALIHAELPDVEQFSGRRDPRFSGNFLARAQLQLMTVFLNRWHHSDIGAALNRFEHGH